MTYRGFYVKISQESVPRVDKDGNEVQCAGFLIEIFENEQSAIPLDRISAAVDFELLEPSVAEATPHGVGRWHEVPEGTAPVRWSSL